MSYALCRAYWRNINRLNTIDRIWDEAHEENEWVLIQRENIALGTLCLEEARERWRKENEVQSP